MPQTDRSDSPLAPLLADPAVRALLQKRARALAAATAPSEPRAHAAYVRFRVGRKQIYGIPQEAVQEVCSVTSIARVPCAPPAVAGVINRRGLMLPVLDLCRMFDVEAAAPGASGMDIIVVSGASLTVGLRVDELIGLDSYPVDTLSPPPHAMGLLPPAHMLGLLAGRVTLLNVERILSDLSPKERQA